MSILPVAERELRVAARRASTFWLRIAAGLAAALVLSGFYTLARVVPPATGLTSSLGPVLFGSLTWLSLAVALSAGIFFTSDCLSAEKREGTIGFLFLTDLRGYDVVFGKLAASCMRGVFALLAVFPVLAMAFLFGGVTGFQFWRSSLAVLNAVFVSLAAGLFVSTLSRDSTKALLGTLGVLGLWIGLGPALDAAWIAGGRAGSGPSLSISSPGYLLFLARAWSPTPEFWWALLVNQAAGWLLLVGASVGLPRVWQERGNRTLTSAQSWRYAWKFGSVKRRQQMRTHHLNTDPIAWLASRERWETVLVWGSTFLLVLIAALWPAGNRMPLWSMLWGMCSGLIVLFLYLGTAARAARFNVQARETGLAELLLVTPLTVNQIIQGQRRALGRLFGLPVLLFLIVQAVGSILAQELEWNRMSTGGLPAATVPSTNTTTTVKTGPGFSVTYSTTSTVSRAGAAGAATTTMVSSGFVPPNPLIALITSLAGSLSFIAEIMALIWFGMWMGLTSKSTQVATLKTLAFVQIIPWFVFGIASGILGSLLLIRIIGVTPAQTMLWYPIIMTGITTVLFVAKDVGFCFWARRKLHREFRLRALGQVIPKSIPIPPVISSVLPEPPAIHEP